MRHVYFKFTIFSLTCIVHGNPWTLSVILSATFDWRSRKTLCCRNSYASLSYSGENLYPQKKRKQICFKVIQQLFSIYFNGESFNWYLCKCDISMNCALNFLTQFKSLHIENVNSGVFMYTVILDYLPGYSLIFVLYLCCNVTNAHTYTYSKSTTTRLY